eukprot:c47893_g1_i1 orf=37-462(+)
MLTLMVRKQSVRFVTQKMSSGNEKLKYVEAVMMLQNASLRLAGLVKGLWLQEQGSGEEVGRLWSRNTCPLGLHVKWSWCRLHFSQSVQLTDADGQALLPTVMATAEPGDRTNEIPRSLEAKEFGEPWGPTLSWSAAALEEE